MFYIENEPIGTMKTCFKNPQNSHFSKGVSPWLNRLTFTFVKYSGRSVLLA